MAELLTEAEQTRLLEIARETIVSHVNGEPPHAITNTTKGMNAKSGCFVTIKQHGQLRGCIGNFVSENPLHLLVQDMARAASTEDPRFYPMKPADLDSFDLEISVLSPLKRISDPEGIVVGKHGIYIIKNNRRGVLLPQVATEQGWDRESFLKHTCIKAGLAEDAWQKDCEIYTFTALVFSEK